MEPIRYILLMVVVLTQLSVHPCNASEYQSPVQRMSQLLAELKKNPGDVQALIDASITYIDLCDYDGARQMASRLAAVSRHSSDSVKALFYSNLLSGWTSLITGQVEEGVNNLKEAYSISKSHDMALQQAMAKNLLGFAYANQELDVTKGLSYYSDALTTARKLGNYRLVISVLNNLADTHLWEKDMSGVKYAEEALKLSRDHGYRYGIAVSLINIIHFRLYTMRDPEGTARMMAEVEHLQNKYGFLPHGEISLLKARRAMAVGDDKDAVRIFGESLDDSAPVMPVLLRIETYMYYSWALIKLQEYTRAIAASKQALDLCRATGYNQLSITLVSGVAYCYEKLGDYEQALAYLREYQQKMDMLWLLGQTEALTKAHIENEVRLNESRISRQQSKIDAQGKYIIALAVGGVILLVCLLLLFNLYRRKGQLVRTVVEREKESLLRERLLRQSLEQTRAELAETDKVADSQTASPTPLTDERTDELIVRFNKLMTEKKIYTDTNISIKSVAETLGTNRTYLSYSINHVFNKSFPQVLAEYRVRAAIDMMNNPENSLPLKAIAAEVGFSSASVFFTTFRNIMGMTPAAYRDSLTHQD